MAELDTATIIHPENGHRFFITSMGGYLELIFPFQVPIIRLSRRDATQLRDRLNEFIEEGK